MPNIVEEPYVEKWIYQKLVASSVLAASPVGAKIFRGRFIPQADGLINLPCVRYYRLYAYDNLTINSSRVYNRLFYRIEACDRSDSIQHLRDIANEVDSLIGIRSVQQVVDSVCVIEYAVRYSTSTTEMQDNGEQFQFLGATYEIAAKSV